MSDKQAVPKRLFISRENLQKGVAVVDVSITS